MRASEFKDVVDLNWCRGSAAVLFAIPLRPGLGGRRGIEVFHRIWSCAGQVGGRTAGGRVIGGDLRAAVASVDNVANADRLSEPRSVTCSIKACARNA